MASRWSVLLWRPQPLSPLRLVSVSHWMRRWQVWWYEADKRSGPMIWRLIPVSEAATISNGSQGDSGTLSRYHYAQGSVSLARSIFWNGEMFLTPKLMSWSPSRLLTRSPFSLIICTSTRGYAAWLSPAMVCSVARNRAEWWLRYWQTLYNISKRLNVYLKIAS